MEVEHALDIAHDPLGRREDQCQVGGDGEQDEEKMIKDLKQGWFWGHGYLL